VGLAKNQPSGKNNLNKKRLVCCKLPLAFKKRKRNWTEQMSTGFITMSTGLKKRKPENEKGKMNSEK
jgi:hypothetical protein